MELLKFSHFQPLVGNKFKVQTGESEYLNLELIEATEKNTEVLETFSLIFKGSQETILNQMTHNFKNEQLGDFEMFITPIRSEAVDAVHYQAVFNCLKNNSQNEEKNI